MSCLKGLPTHIRIGGMIVRIQIVEEVTDGDSWGDFSCVKYLIRLDKSIPSNTKAVEVVLHEVLHAVYRFAAVHPQDDEERMVTIFSTWLAMVFMDNPGLVRWIASATR